MSDRALKALTTGLLLFGLALMLCWPALVSPLHDHGTLLQRKQLLVRYTVYFTVLIVDFFGTMVCAWLLVRRARLQAMEESRENLRMLIEGTLHDHKAKNTREQP